MRRMLCGVLAFTLVLAAGSAPCRAETASTANSAPAREPPAKQPSFCFQGAAPDRQEASGYAERAQRDASRASQPRAGDADETVLVVAIAVVCVVCLVGVIYLTSVVL
ncbi:MAG: hypothetical protein ACLQVA_01935 [Candidatus Brocadiia bacterium]